MPSKKTVPKRRRAKATDEVEFRDEGAATDFQPDAVGKGSASLQPLTKEQINLDYKAGVIMVITFPLAILFFWKVTLPITWFVIQTVLGEETLLKLFYFKQDVLATFLSDCPSWIPAVERAYLDDRLEETVRRIPSPKTRQEFEEIINSGEPIIITDAMKGWEGFGTWDCNSFIQKYHDAEYFDWQADTKYKLGNITKRPNYDGMTCAAGYIEDYWPENAKYVQDWLAKMSPMPSFLPENAFTHESPMTGFVGMPGTGVSPHLDETCDSLMTAQFSGVKNWSLSWPVKEDGKVRWRKPVVFTLYPGDIMFWYTNMRHHTEVIHGCSLSFSFRLHTPVPKTYYVQQSEIIASLSESERTKLYDETHTSDMYFLDRCRLISKGGQLFIS